MHANKLKLAKFDRDRLWTKYKPQNPDSNATTMQPDTTVTPQNQDSDLNIMPDNLQTVDNQVLQAPSPPVAQPEPPLSPSSPRSPCSPPFEMQSATMSTTEHNVQTSSMDSSQQSNITTATDLHTQVPLSEDPDQTIDYEVTLPDSQEQTADSNATHQTMPVGITTQSQPSITKTASSEQTSPKVKITSNDKTAGQDTWLPVDKILKKRRKGRETEFLTKFLGQKQTIWLPAKDISPKLIAEFLVESYNKRRKRLNRARLQTGQR